MSNFLIDFGLDIASRSPSGSIFSTAAAAAKDPFARFQQANQMAAFEPYQRLGAYGQGIGQIAPMMGGTTSTMIPDPTALQTALGWTSVMGGIMNPNLGR